MAWIKRNLFFVIGSFIALALMGVGGYYLYTQVSDEGQVADQIAAQYAELTRLTGLTPHPGDDKIDNIKAAKEQAAALRAYIAKTRPFFQRIAPIPDSTTTNKISDRDFASALRITVSQLQHNATQQSVLLPPDYYFTFEAQKKLMNFDPASLDAMSLHLGEIKALCQILFDAKVNSLDSIRREIISINNDNNPPDYLPEKTVSTPLADLTPYEITFRSFSTELAQVLGGLASSTNAFFVKTINIEPAGSTGPEEANGMMNPNGTTPTQVMPQPIRRPSEGGRYAPPMAVVPVAPVSSRGPQVVLNEKPFRVTLMVYVVKIKPVVK